jgi:hypothetical protein
MGSILSCGQTNSRILIARSYRTIAIRPMVLWFRRRTPLMDHGWMPLLGIDTSSVHGPRRTEGSGCALGLAQESLGILLLAPRPAGEARATSYTRGGM